MNQRTRMHAIQRVHALTLLLHPPSTGDGHGALVSGAAVDSLLHPARCASSSNPAGWTCARARAWLKAGVGAGIRLAQILVHRCDGTVPPAPQRGARASVSERVYEHVHDMCLPRARVREDARVSCARVGECQRAICMCMSCASNVLWTASTFETSFMHMRSNRRRAATTSDATAASPYQLLKTACQSARPGSRRCRSTASRPCRALWAGRALSGHQDAPTPPCNAHAARHRCR